MTVKINLIFCFLFVLWTSSSAQRYELESEVKLEVKKCPEKECHGATSLSKRTALKGKPLDINPYVYWNEKTVITVHGSFYTYNEYFTNFTADKVVLSKYGETPRIQKNYKFDLTGSYTMMHSFLDSSATQMTWLKIEMTVYRSPGYLVSNSRINISCEAGAMSCLGNQCAESKLIITHIEIDNSANGIIDAAKIKADKMKKIKPVSEYAKLWGVDGQVSTHVETGGSGSCSSPWTDKSSYGGLKGYSAETFPYNFWNEKTEVEAWGDFRLETDRDGNSTAVRVSLTKYTEDHSSKTYSTGLIERNTEGGEWQVRQHTNYQIYFKVFSPHLVKLGGSRIRVWAESSADSCWATGSCSAQAQISHIYIDNSVNDRNIRLVEYLGDSEKDIDEIE